MATSILKSTFGFVSGFFTRAVPNSARDGSRTDAQAIPNSLAPSHGRKRKSGEDDDEDQDDDYAFTPTAKRRRLFKSRPDYIPYKFGDNGDIHSSHFASTGQTKADTDRALMPPPTTPLRKQIRPRDDDAISFASTNLNRRRIEDMDEEQMEAARRHAAATKIPEDSGVWSETEQDLFYHLAYRGFEPLLPQNWMIDFDTLPLSVFADEDSTDLALIHSNRDNQFRAAHALRNLLEAGHDVRDRNHVSPGLRRERILARVVKRYLNWALGDVGLRPSSDPDFLATHIILTHKKGRSTLKTLQEMASKLHNLAERHRHNRKVHQSIETDLSTVNMPATQSKTVVDELCPTITGLVIVSSVVVVVTLNPSAEHAFDDPDGRREPAQTLSPPISTSSKQLSGESLRTMISLDFSKSDQDVWNALGIAIVAMSIRKEALKANTPQVVDDGWDGASFVTSKYGDDDMMSRIGDLDDPDL